MRRSARLAEKRPKVENDAHTGQTGPKTKKKRSNDKISKIATLDNGTMVEAFKHLNYCQLAKNSLVSKRFRDVIQTHRRKLALLHVCSIDMHCYPIASTAIEIFDKELSPEAYNEWIICNSYSKQVPFEDQVSSTQNVLNGYSLYAAAHYKDPNHRGLRDITAVFFAEVELNQENWPVFQHFVRLVTDPFIYTDCMDLTYQNDVLNLLAGTINSDRRLQCKKLEFNLNGHSQKSFTWTKNNVRCNQFYIYGKGDLNQDEAFLDFFVTGGHCTLSIVDITNDLFKAMIGLVQKFTSLTNSDESQLVPVIEGNFESVKLLKSDYAEFIVQERSEVNDSSVKVFEFVNNNIGKKLQLTIDKHGYYWSHFSIKINDL